MDETEPVYRTGMHEESVIQWDDYHGEPTLSSRKTPHSRKHSLHYN